MRGLESQPAGRSLTFRAVPDDVRLAIKRCVTEYNVAHPDAPLGQTDVVVEIVRDWVARGGQVHADVPAQGP